jgi:hypothetical protein
MIVTVDHILLVGVGLGGMIGGYVASKAGAGKGASVLNGTAQTIQSLDVAVTALILQVARMETRLERCPLADRRGTLRAGEQDCR